MTFREGIVSVDTNDGDSLAGVGIVVRPNKHCQFTVARSGNKVCNCTVESSHTSRQHVGIISRPERAQRHRRRRNFKSTHPAKSVRFCTFVLVTFLTLCYTRVIMGRMHAPGKGICTFQILPRLIRQHPQIIVLCSVLCSPLPPGPPFLAEDHP